MKLPEALKWLLACLVASNVLLATSLDNGDPMKTESGNNFCVTTAKSRVSSRVLYNLALRTSAAFVSSGYSYASGQAGKWTVEITRADTAYSNLTSIQNCFNLMKGLMFRLGDENTVSSHTMGSVGNWSRDGSSETARMYVWITQQISAFPGYKVLMEKQSDDEEFILPLPKHLKNTEIQWKGRGRIIEAPLALARSIGKPSPALLDDQFGDVCITDDNNNSFYTTAADTSIRDCIYSVFPGLSCQFCCNGCTQDGSSCCPDGFSC